MHEFQPHQPEAYEPPELTDLQAQAVTEARQSVINEREALAEAGFHYAEYAMGVTSDGRFVSVERPLDESVKDSIVRVGYIDGMAVGGAMEEHRVVLGYEKPVSGRRHYGETPDSGDDGAWLDVGDATISVQQYSDRQAGKLHSIKLANEPSRTIYPISEQGRSGPTISGSTDPVKRPMAAAPFGATIAKRPHAPKPAPESKPEPKPEQVPNNESPAPANETKPVLPDPRIEGAPKESFHQGEVERLEQSVKQLADVVDMTFGAYAENIVKDPRTGAEQLDLYVSSNRAKGTSNKGVHHELLPSKLRLTRTWDENWKSQVISLEVDPSKSNEKVHPRVRDHSGSKHTLFVAPGEPAVFVEGKMRDGELIKTPHEINTVGSLKFSAKFWAEALREAEPRRSRFKKAIKFLGKSALGDIE